MSVVLEPLAAADFQPWLEHHVAGYAEDKVRAGQWGRDGALERARQDTTRFLPDGVDTAGHTLSHIVDVASKERVGSLWWCLSERFGRRVAFIFNIEIHEAARRRGHAKAAIQQLEAHARAIGVEALSLHVFAFNHGARALYDQLGFSVTSVTMSRELGTAGSDSRHPPDGESSA